MQAAHITNDYIHTRDRIGICSKYKHYRENSKDEKWPEFFLAAARLELTTLCSIHSTVSSDSSVLHYFGCSSALVKFLSGRGPFFMAGSRTQPLKGIAIQTTPAPLLSLQHVAIDSLVRSLGQYKCRIFKKST